MSGFVSKAKFGLEASFCQRKAFFQILFNDRFGGEIWIKSKSTVSFGGVIEKYWVGIHGTKRTASAYLNARS